MPSVGCAYWVNGRTSSVFILMCLTAHVVHFLLVCLYPQLQSFPYELCKATGPGHCVLVPLTLLCSNRDQKRDTFCKPPLVAGLSILCWIGTTKGADTNINSCVEYGGRATCSEQTTVNHIRLLSMLCIFPL